jgi:hypothetical protein
MRCKVWPYLFKFYPFTSPENEQQKISIYNKKKKEFGTLKLSWNNYQSDDYLNELYNRIWRDVIRTDVNHPFYKLPKQSSTKEHSENVFKLQGLLMTYGFHFVYFFIIKNLGWKCK